MILAFAAGNEEQARCGHRWAESRPGDLASYIRTRYATHCCQECLLFGRDTEVDIDARKRELAETPSPLAAAIAQFPKEFGLRNFPGETFKISPFHSYESDYPKQGTIYLYTYVRRGDAWEAFAKGTPEELRQEVVA